MGTYDVQQVCLNGHQITSMMRKYPEFARKHCSTCGAETISACPNCQQPIPGEYHLEHVFGPPTAEVPERCENCGGVFPWTGKLPSSMSPRDAVQLVTRLCNRFHVAAVQLRRRHDNRDPFPLDDEYDIQDLMHAFLCLDFEDVRPEEWTPSYAGSSSRMDFLLKNEQIVLETKMTRTKLREREVGEQLIVDIEKYRKHPNCKTLVCFVYDPNELIRNPSGLEADLTRDEKGFRARVIVGPKRS